MSNRYLTINCHFATTKDTFGLFSFFEGIGKKIDALAKQKDCEDAGLWRSIVNHLYWIAATAPEGDGDMLEAMWKSVTNHIQDIRNGHSILKCILNVPMAHWMKMSETKSGWSLVSKMIMFIIFFFFLAVLVILLPYYFIS